jgi:hypothetical protein
MINIGIIKNTEMFGEYGMWRDEHMKVLGIWGLYGIQGIWIIWGYGDLKM